MIIFCWDCLMFKADSHKEGYCSFQQRLLTHTNPACVAGGVFTDMSNRIKALEKQQHQPDSNDLSKLGGYFDV